MCLFNLCTLSLEETLSIKIYYNPRCSKSRKTLEILEQKGLNPKIIDYIKNPPSKQEIEELLGLLGAEPIDILRTTDPMFKEAGLDDPMISRDDQIETLLGCPSLMQRPIVVSNGKAIICRPPEKVLEII